MTQPLDRRGILLSITAMATAVSLVTFVAMPPFNARAATLALNLAVVYIVFRSGQTTGIASATVSILFLALHLSAPGRPFIMDREGVRDFVLSTISLPVTTAIAIFLKRREQEVALRLAAQTEEAGRARASELQFRRIADGSPAMIWLTGPTGERTFFNQGWLEFTGAASLADLTDGGWRKLIHPDDLALTTAVWPQTFRSGESWEVRYRLKRRDGDYRWVLEQARPFRGASGRQLGYSGSCVDLTLFLQTQDDLNMLINASYNGIMAMSLDSRITIWNPAMERMTGVPARDIGGSGSTGVLARILDAAELAKIEHVLSAAQPATSLDGRLSNSAWFDATYSPLRRPTGEIAGLVAVFHETTGRKLAERAMRESESRYRALFESDMIGIVVSAAGGEVVDANDEYLRLVGRTRAELPSLRWDAAASGSPFEMDCVQPGGSRVPALVGTAPVKDQEGLLVGYVLDMSRVKEAETALRHLSGELMRSRDEERRRISRELHDSTAQNLAALSMNLSLLSGAEQIRNQPALVRLIDDATGLAETSVREIRTLSYLLHPPLLDDLGLEAALRVFVNGFAQRTSIAVDLTIEFGRNRLSPDIETTVFRIVQESLANIHRHSGSPSAQISVWSIGGQVNLEVADQGRGVEVLATASGEELPKLGVGITGMRERARQLGGTLEIESSASGTLVRAVLPLA